MIFNYYTKINRTKSISYRKFSKSNYHLIINRQLNLNYKTDFLFLHIMRIAALKTRNFENEFVFLASRSSGPGGQHVNKVSSKVELRFNIPASDMLSKEEKELLLEKLSGKVNNEGDLIITSQTSRSQQKNKTDTIEKFYTLLAKALTPPRKRIKTKPPKSTDRKRLEEKRKQSNKKEKRKPPEIE